MYNGPGYRLFTLVILRTVGPCIMTYMPGEVNEQLPNYIVQLRLHAFVRP